MFEYLRALDYLPDPLLPLEVRQVAVRKGTAPHHSHDFMEMVMVVAGRGTHVCEEVAHPIVRGDIFVIDTIRKHHYVDPEDLTVWLMLYDEAYFLSVSPALAFLSGFHGFFHLEPKARTEFGLAGTVHLEERATRAAEETLATIRDEKLRERDGYALMCSSLFLCFLVDLCRRFAGVDTSVATWLTRVGDVVTLLTHRYRRSWSLDELAGRAGMSVSTLLRQFKRATGKTPKQYQLEVRLDHARRLLSETGATVSEIALRTGFANGSYLARAFRSRFGSAPREFRRLDRAGHIAM